MPTVSVIIPTYNRAYLVSQAIESVLAQTYTSYEIIVINDGSPDNTKEVLDKYADKITALHQENQGVAAARNAGLKVAVGRYIAFLDDDDLWLPNKLEKQIAYLESNPNIGLVYSDMFCFDENGVLPHTWSQANPTPPVQECWILFVRNFIPMPSVVVRRECLNQIGLFDNTVIPCEDYDMWLRLIEKFPVHFLNEPLVRYRRSPDSLQKNEERQLVSWLRVKEKAFHRNPSLKTLPMMVLDQCFFNGYLSLAYTYIQRTQGEKARQVLDKYIQIRGSHSVSDWLWMISFPRLTASSTSSDNFSVSTT
jgi:GT2 family glycosyltransferase